jgi:lysophospholipase L1-like esterase
MKKEHWLLLTSTGLSLLLALGLIRWLAPELLGVPADLRLVRVSQEVPPFYANVFSRSDDAAEDGLLIKDPVVRVRAPVLYPDAGDFGPNDVLGFRNRQVPNLADVVVVGDSQTYGNNAQLEQNWPSRMRTGLSGRPAEVYAMATGGWAAPQYLEISRHAAALRPRVLVVAFYSGNDPLESFALAYGSDVWASLRVDPRLSSRDAPRAAFPAPEAETWPVSFPDGVKTVFTPQLRWVSNAREHPAVHAGYRIMAEVASRIASLPGLDGAQLVFTIVPTKELVHARKVKAAGLDAPPAFQGLVRDEPTNIAWLAEQLRSIPRATYVDLVAPLQEAALGPAGLYPEDANGHPVAEGYAVIGRVVAEALSPLLPPDRRGLVALQTSAGGTGRTFRVFLRTSKGVWLVPVPQLLESNGWEASDIPMVTERDLAGVPLLGQMTADPERFGPQGVDVGACGGL